MANQIARAEAWEVVHEAFTQVNFNSFDYNTIKESLLDYVKLYFPEDFNDYIESSEFIAILEIFAYVGELLAYRLDLNAHENFIDTAQRKESILRLAKLISYKASRNIPARGLVKISSIQTTEQVIDSQGRNLAGRKIVWNDLNNTDWKEQFLLVMNRVLSQDFGSVAPNERVQIEDVLFELYTWNNQSLKSSGVTAFSYSSASAGQSFPMELVPVELTSESPVEKRPERDAKFSLLYGTDGLGDASDTTGFFCFTKQGTLQVEERSFDGITPNQTLDIETNNINETDVWLNNVNPSTREVLITDPVAEILPHLSDGATRYGEWFEVDLANGQNIIFNTDLNRQKYELEALDNDQIKIIFGDGEFSEVPDGAFDLWYRVSANSDTLIQKTSVIDSPASFTYLDLTNTAQTITFSFSLISSLQNGSVSEDIEHIRRVAPGVYYTQDRMVNGRDYNSFMLKDPSILKLRSVNRTFAGDSKYIAWHDPKEYYEDVKIFGEDLALYWNQKEPLTGSLATTTTFLLPTQILTNFIEPLLCSADFYNIIVEELAQAGRPPSDIKCFFTASETSVILGALDTAALGSSPIVNLYFSGSAGAGSPVTDQWTTEADYPDSLFMIRVEAQFTASALSGWTVNWSTKRMIAQSETTKFRSTNTTASVINFDTLNSNDDSITILAANTNGTGDGIFANNRPYNVLGQELVEQNLPSAGLPDDNRLSVIPTDTNSDGIPDDIPQAELLNATETFTISGTTVTFTEPNMHYVLGHSSDTLIVKVNGNEISAYTEESLPTNEAKVTSIELDTPLGGSPIDNVEVTAKQFVYFYRASTTADWEPIASTTGNKNNWRMDTLSEYKREYGRYPLNFAWFYTTPRLHLVDPAPSNIIDTFIITRAYYQGLARWLENKTDTKPTPPTPLDLRTAYAELLESRMISDTVILQTGEIKILFGPRAIPELQANFKVIRPSITSLTDNEVKVKIIETMRTYFDLNYWSFGESFFFTELSAAIHNDLGPEIKSIVLVPTFDTNQFGDLFQVQSRENEIFAIDVSTTNIEIIDSFTPENIRQ